MIPLASNTETPTRAKIRVLCVDDNRDITKMLAQCIDRESDMESAGSVFSADNLNADVERTRADVVLLDMTMSGKDPLAALRELGKGGTAASIIVFSGRDDQNAIDSAVEAGASGFLSKAAKVPVMLGAIREVAVRRAGEAEFGVWR